MSLERRAFLRRVASGAVGALAATQLDDGLVAWGREVHAAVGKSTSGVLDDAGLRVLGIACDRILPADETPGALAAGVPDFVVHMLADWYAPEDRVRIAEGLTALAALEQDGRVFADLPPDRQDAILVAFDQAEPEHWFHTLKFLTIWGYYTSEIAATRELPPVEMGRYDGNAPYTPRRREP